MKRFRKEKKLCLGHRLRCATDDDDDLEEGSRGGEFSEYDLMIMTAGKARRSDASLSGRFSSSRSPLVYSTISFQFSSFFSVSLSRARAGDSVRQIIKRTDDDVRTTTDRRSRLVNIGGAWLPRLNYISVLFPSVIGDSPAPREKTYDVHYRQP